MYRVRRGRFSKLWLRISYLALTPTTNLPFINCIYFYKLRKCEFKAHSNLGTRGGWKQNHSCENKSRRVMIPLPWERERQMNASYAVVVGLFVSCSSISLKASQCALVCVRERVFAYCYFAFRVCKAKWTVIYRQFVCSSRSNDRGLRILPSCVHWVCEELDKALVRCLLVSRCSENVKFVE